MNSVPVHTTETHSTTPVPDPTVAAKLAIAVTRV